MQPTITFAGGAGTVTGSKYLVRHRGHQVLLDCGLFQGLKSLRMRNWAAPTFDPRAIAAVVLSHAHLDHSGYVPVLVRLGFRGRVYCTAGTRDLLRILWMDAARLQEEDAARAARHGYSRHRPPLALFTVDDAERALAHLETRPRDQVFPVSDGTRARFHRAGHILGASTVELHLQPTGEDADVRLLFSGDLGHRQQPLLCPPDPPCPADVLLIESTYGDRERAADGIDRLADAIRVTAARGGHVIIPAFAVGRAQDLLWHLRELEEAGRIPSLPVYLDSPMAIDATDIFARHPDEHSAALRERSSRSLLPWLRARMLRTADESRTLNTSTSSTIIIAGSGMATGGRVLHHLERCLPDPENTVLLVGYQAAGTRGRSLQDGAATLRLHGRDIPVRAQVTMVEGLSAHADRGELLGWLDGMATPPAMTWVVHGEPRAASALTAAINARPGWQAAVAQDGATVELARRRAPGESSKPVRSGPG